MKKRLIALLLVVALLMPAGIASAAAWYRVNTTSLIVRYMPSESAKVLGSYRRDYALNILSTSDGWSYVQFSNGFKGYVQTKYLKRGSSYSAWITNDGTSLRRGPDGGFGVTATLSRGTKVTVLTHGTKYDYVNAGKFGTGYVVNSLLSKKKVKPSDQPSTLNGYGDVNYYAWINHVRNVNIRQSPNTTAPIVTTVAPAAKVHVIYHGAQWDKIETDTDTGWIQNRFLSRSAPAETPVPDPTPDPDADNTYTAYVVTPDKKAVNVRKGNSTNYTVLFKVGYGAPVKVLKHDKTWDYIQYGAKKGYVKNVYLQLTKPQDAPDYTPVPDVTPTPKPFQEYVGEITSPDGKSVNFHSGKGDGYSNVTGVGRLKVGTVVTVIAISGDWAQLRYMGYVGWIHKQYVKPLN